MEYSKTKVEPINRVEISAVITEVQKAFQGHEDKIEPLLLALFSGQHILLEDIPGVGKTTLAKAFARATGLDFGRIQFTPDLLPGDVVGMTIWNPESRKFLFKPGSVYHSFVLADEINRASPRTQSALLEAMQEGTVTVDGRTRSLPQPFLVVATQNPIEFAGTFPLPEAQIDRFGLRVSLGYPGRDESLSILELDDHPAQSSVKPVLDKDRILPMRSEVKAVELPLNVKDFVLQIGNHTRRNPGLKLGLSPRSLKQWVGVAKASAWLRSRTMVLPEDLIHTVYWALPHRLVLTGDALLEERTPHSILEDILGRLDLPDGI